MFLFLSLGIVLLGLGVWLGVGWIANWYDVLYYNTQQTVMIKLGTVWTTYRYFYIFEDELGSFMFIYVCCCCCYCYCYV